MTNTAIEFPLIITVDDYHEFESYVDNFKANGIPVAYTEIGYGCPQKKSPTWAGYVGVFWLKGQKTENVKNLIKKLKLELNKEDNE